MALLFAGCWLTLYIPVVYKLSQCAVVSIRCCTHYSILSSHCILGGCFDLKPDALDRWMNRYNHVCFYLRTLSYLFIHLPGNVVLASKFRTQSFSSSPSEQSICLSHAFPNGINLTERLQKKYLLLISLETGEEKEWHVLDARNLFFNKWATLNYLDWFLYNFSVAIRSNREIIV